MNSIADSVMGTTPTKSERPVHGPMPRAGRRAARQFDARNAKRATRKHRRDAMDGLQNQQTALGLARVYLGGTGNEAMYLNVQRHIQSMGEQLARQNRPEVFADDTLSPEDQFAAEKAAYDEAIAQITARLQEVLDAHAV